MLVYRTGQFAPLGIPWADGKQDYLKLINARDGGVNGVKLVFEECETAYDAAKGVECYDRLKAKGSGASGFDPQSTGITFAVTDKALTDKVAIQTMGYGLSQSVDGTVFEWNFPLLGTYWTATDIILQDIARKEKATSKARRSPWSTTTRPMARSRSRCCRSWPPRTASTSPSSPSRRPASNRSPPGCRSASSVPITFCSGARGS